MVFTPSFSAAIKEPSYRPRPWICLEPVKEDLKVVRNGFLGFDLPIGTTIEKAKKIAEFLGENITTVSYTKP